MKLYKFKAGLGGSTWTRYIVAENIYKAIDKYKENIKNDNRIPHLTSIECVWSEVIL